MEGWRGSVFTFTRGLKFDCGMEGTPMAEVRPHVEEWYEAAKPVIGDLPFSEVWCEVVAAWDRAKRPAFQAPLTKALAKAREEDGVPPVPSTAGYDDPVVVIAYRLLFWLALSQDERFFISCRALGESPGSTRPGGVAVAAMFRGRRRGRMPEARQDVEGLALSVERLMRSVPPKPRQGRFPAQQGRLPGRGG